MFKNVLVGIDGGPGGADALALASALGAPDAVVTLTNTWSPEEGMLSAIVGGAHPARAGRDALHRASAKLGRSCHIIEQEASSPGEGLHAIAERREVDLLVVGATAAPGSTRSDLGDHARATVQDAPCAVAVARAGYAADATGLRRIGVAWERRPAARAALDAGRALAAETGAALHAFSAVPPVPAAWVPPPIAAVAVAEDLAGEDVRRRRAELTAAGAPHGHVARGMPVALLCDWSREVDLLILGSRGLGRLGRLLLGSTSDGVVRGAACSVLVVQHP